MANEIEKGSSVHTEEPAEGSREVVDRELKRQEGGSGRNEENHRETGGRILKQGKGSEPNRAHTGDRGDEPKEPYGLTEPSDDRGEATRHADGRGSIV